MSRLRPADRLRASRRTVTALAVLGGIAVTACGSTPVALSAKKSPTAKPATSTPLPPTPTPTPTPPPPAIAGATYAAPALVQVENLNAARPQSGLSSANIVYEYSAEGGISRFTAIYFSSPKGAVGPVRSARLISPVLIKEYGGVLVFSGSSVYVHNVMNGENTPRFDETSAGRDMFRISSRYAPHNLYTDGGRVDDMVHRSNRPAVGYQLWSRAASAAGGRTATSFVAPVSPSEQPVYTWNAQLNGYARSEPDTGPFVDANTGQVIAPPTVVVMQVPARINPQDIEDGCCTAGWEYTLNGSGPAQVFTSGTEWDATWSMNGTGAPQFSLAGGAAAPINQGAVWIEVVPQGQSAAFH